jgi:hypothetical protein
MEDGINLRAFLRFAGELADLAASHSCNRLLNDLRKATIQMSVFDLYCIPVILNLSERNPVKSALVVARDFSDYHFLETVCINRGQLVKVFKDLDSAEQWQEIKKYANSNQKHELVV